MQYWNITSIRGGFSDENNKGQEGSFKFGYGWDIHARDEGFVAKNSKVSTSNTNVEINQLINFFVPCSDGSLYAFGASGSIYATSGGAGDWEFVYNDENGGILGATEWRLSDGNKYLMWTTATSVSRTAINGSKDIPWSTPEINWKTTLENPNDTFHDMVIASGQVNIGNSNYIATVDYDGNFVSDGLDLRAGLDVSALSERDDYIIIGTNDRTSQSQLVSWISTALSWIQKKVIPEGGINAFSESELPIMQVGNKGNFYASDFSDPSIVAQTPQGEGFCSTPGASTLYDGRAFFALEGGADNGIEYSGLYSYGRKHRDRPYSFFLDYIFSTGNSSVSGVGACQAFSGDIYSSVYYDWEEGSEYRDAYEIVSASGSFTSFIDFLYESLEFDAGVPNLNKQLHGIKFITIPVSGLTMTLAARYKLDRGDWRYFVTASGETTYTVPDNTEEIIFTSGGQAKTIEIGFEGYADNIANPLFPCVSVMYDIIPDTDYA